MTFYFCLKNFVPVCHYGQKQWDQILCILEKNKYVFKSVYKFQFIISSYLISFRWLHLQIVMTTELLGTALFFKKWQGILYFSEHTYTVFVTIVTFVVENTIS